MSEIMVDILCMAYNHEKYIRRTLDGFLMQETNFKYRIIVHDDASTDSTADIIREYEEKFPDIICPIYQVENQYSQKKSINRFQFAPRVQAKYVAICEGDDFWIDKTKLQQQFDALEMHPECHMCVHTVQAVTEDEKPLSTIYPVEEQETGELSSSHVIGAGYSYQTSSYFLNAKDYVDYHTNRPAFMKGSFVGDICYLLHFASLGNIYYINKIMSNYRFGVPTSWSARQLQNVFSKNFVEHQKRNFNTLYRFNEHTNGKYYDVLLKRLTKFKLRILIFERRAIDFFKEENKPYFNYLNAKKKLFVFIGIICPPLTDYYYRKRFEKHFKKRGY